MRKKLTRFVRPRIVGHLENQQFSALEALPDGVDAGDGGTLQPHGHQRLPELLVTVILEGDPTIAAGGADQGHRGGPDQKHGEEALHFDLSSFFFPLCKPRRCLSAHGLDPSLISLLQPRFRL